MGKVENQNAVRHGGAGAIKRIAQGKPLIGMAAEAEQRVSVELEESGAAAIMQRNAIQNQAATDLYWDAICKAAQDNDMAVMDKYIARYGWLSGVTMRAWVQVAALEKRERGKDAQAVIEYYRKGVTNDDNKHS